MQNGKNNVKPIPEGAQVVTPHLVVQGAAAALEFYRKAFGAEELCRMPMPGGKLGHAEIKIGAGTVMLCDEFPEMGARSPLALGGSPVTIHLYVEDVDAVFAQAVGAGAQVRMPVSNMFWGDRYGQVIDPFGHIWSLATHIEDLSMEEMARRAEAAFSNPGACVEQPAAV
jgi:uncharacterized glyoxalase superfamily protein PhnB